jgi:4-hydroxy-tetrahydrodipicolinate synthase
MTGKTKKIEGVSLFSVTPIGADGGIDFGRWKQHVDEAIAAGIHNLTLFGSTGSNGFITEQEKMKSLTTMVEHVAGRIPIMFGIGSLTTDESARLATFASENGADAVLVVPITYWKPTEDELLAHYEAIAAASKIPVWAYNNPSLAGVDLTPSFMVKLSKLAPNLVGMKDSSGDLTRVFRVPALTDGKVMVGLGQDVIPVEPMLGPAPGWFTGLANFCPSQCVELWNAAKSGDADKTYKLARKLFDVSEIGGRYGIVRVAHTALEIMGKPAGGPRAPLRSLQGPAREELNTALAALGLV